jgi:hypothetical protein
MGSYFKSRKGVRQGDPVTPLLFNLAPDCLVKMVQIAQENNLVKGLISDIIPSGFLFYNMLTTLFYVWKMTWKH